MKRILIIPAIFILSGCPGGGKPAPTHKGVFMQGDTICFSINKNDVLDYYTVATTQNKKYRIILVDEGVHLSYPETCFKIKLANGYNYEISYGVNGKYYYDQFFIDNDGNR